MIKYLPLKEINARHGEEIRNAVSRVLDSGWYLRGEATRQFEQHYSEYIGTRHCIGVANGLDALTLILRAYIEMGIMKEGDEVIVPANTFIASILAITDNHLVPVLVEPRLDTLQIDDALIEQAITAKTRAVMIVHLYGICAYTPRIADICRHHGLKLIEDNAQSHGCRYKPFPGRDLERVCGSLGDSAGHSFYPGKNLGALGDAGAVTTNDDELATTVRALGNYGSNKKYVHDLAGRNSRIDELQAAMLDVKLRHLDADNRHRLDIANVYLNHVKHPLIRLPQTEGRDSVWHTFPVLSPRRDDLQHYLLNHGVETQIHYPIPPHLQRCYANRANHGEGSHNLSLRFYPENHPHDPLPITEQIAAQELSLPCHPAMTHEEADYIADLLNKF